MSLEDDILINRYLKGTLSDTELKAFTLRLHSDLDFKKNVDLEKQLLETLNNQEWSFIDTSESHEAISYKEIYKSDEIQDLKKILYKENEIFQKQKRKKLNKWILYVSAAVIALLVTLNVFYTSHTSQELYNDYILADNLPSLISREITKESDLVKAQLFFENREYDKALSIFKSELSKTDEKNGVIFLYVGIAQMELNKLDEARSTFELLISSNLLDSERGKWYLALLYLKLNEIEKSKKLLDEISKDSLFNYGKANTLLKKIPKIKNSKK